MVSFTWDDDDSASRLLNTGSHGETFWGHGGLDAPSCMKPVLPWN